MEKAQSKELALQSLERERGGGQIYEAALECVVNEELKEEFSKCLEQTRNHARLLMQVCSNLGCKTEQPKR